MCKGNHWCLSVCATVSDEKYIYFIAVLVADSNRLVMLVLDSFKHNNPSSIPDTNLKNLKKSFDSVECLSLDVRPSLQISLTISAATAEYGRLHFTERVLGNPEKFRRLSSPSDTAELDINWDCHGVSSLRQTYYACLTEGYVEYVSSRLMLMLAQSPAKAIRPGKFPM
jgi:hypothetical protein